MLSDIQKHDENISWDEYIEPKWGYTYLSCTHVHTEQFHECKPNVSVVSMKIARHTLNTTISKQPLFNLKQYLNNFHVCESNH